jgi:dihydropyrimidine dehydrogenase (NAD+) subunit PreA
MIDGLESFMDREGYRTIEDFKGKALRNTVDWNDLNLNFDLKARIDDDKCIECGRCFIACEDTSHQAIRIDAKPGGGRKFTVIDDECVGCNLCQHVCPVTDCIEMVELVDDRPKVTWPNHPKNPARVA